ncbi:hypothetical protein BDL97_03G054800 [Sphagnum fallax]|nr:hypothetical protein BDL97_03G054800 [Sphagnum fallax]
MMHVMTMENFKESTRGNSSDREVVSIPLVPVLDLAQQKGLRADMEDGHNMGFALLSSSLCKSLEMIEPPASSNMLEHVQDSDSVCSDPEVTWAVQVLDKLITLAKQWHIVTNPGYKSARQPIFESKAPKLEQESELQMQSLENCTLTSPPKVTSQGLSLQVQQATDFLKRQSLEHANHNLALMQETVLDDGMNQMASQNKLPGCSEAAVKTHDNTECENGLQAETIQEPAIKQKQTRAQIHDDVCTKRFLEDIRAEFEQYPPQSLEEFEIHDSDDLLEPQFAAQVDHGTPTRGDNREDSQHLNPSPSSFTFKESPISVLSEEDQLTLKPLKRLFVEIPPQEDQSFHEFYDSKVPSSARTELEYPCGSAFIYRASPASTLSAEPDEQPHLTEVSDSSEQNELRYPCSSTFVYRDESSDSESFEDDPHEQLQVMKAAPAAATTDLPSKLPVIHTFGFFNTDSNLRYGKQPTELATGYDMPEQTEIQAEGGEPPDSPGFGYTDSPVSVLPKLSTDEYQTSETATSSPDVDLPELQLFHQASNLEPWLQRDGEALDEEDLQFLFPPHAKYRDIIISEESVLRRGHERSCTWTPELQNQCCSRSSDLGRSRGQSKRHQELSRSIGQLAQDLSKWHSVDIHQSQKSSTDDDDEEIFPSVKSWEIQEEEGTPKKTPIRRHRKQQGQKTISVASLRSQSTSLVPSTKRRSNSEFVPCSGRLFSWPGRILSFSPGSKVRFRDMSERGSVNRETSFGGSAKRDAHQVKSILKGSHRNHASVTVADILQRDFG